jgi:hypothetical protein
VQINTRGYEEQTMDPEQIARYKAEYYGAETWAANGDVGQTGDVVLMAFCGGYLMHVEALEENPSLRELLNQHGGLVLARVGSHPPWPARVSSRTVPDEGLLALISR